VYIFAHRDGPGELVMGEGREVSYNNIHNNIL